MTIPVQNRLISVGFTLLPVKQDLLHNPKVRKTPIKDLKQPKNDPILG